MLFLLSASNAFTAPVSRVGGIARAAVASERGGHVDVRGCTFDLGHAQDVGLRLAADTTGTVVDNPADRRGLWGPFVPPAGVHTDTAELED